MYYLRKQKEIKNINSFACGSLLELVEAKSSRDHISIVFSEDLSTTKGHYHLDNDEYYICLNGEMTVLIYDPEEGKKRSINIKKSEVLFIGKGVHHKIIGFSESSSFLAISLPKWTEKSERFSTIIP